MRISPLRSSPLPNSPETNCTMSTHGAQQFESYHRQGPGLQGTRRPVRQPGTYTNTNADIDYTSTASNYNNCSRLNYTGIQVRFRHCVLMYQVTYDIITATVERER